MRSVTDRTPPRDNKENFMNSFSSPGQTPKNVTISPQSNKQMSYYEKGPQADYRTVLGRNQDIDSMLSKEEIFKI